MKRTIILLLTLVLLLSLVSPALAASPYVEADSAAELAQLLAPRARVFSLFGQKQTARLLVLNETLPDLCGADRVLHYAAYEEYILEFSDFETAEAARDTLTEVYGLDRVWLDDVKATVADEVLEPSETSEPVESTTAPEEPTMPVESEAPVASTEPTESPEPTATAEPTAPVETETPAPTHTPEPVATAEPIETPDPAATPVPTAYAPRSWGAGAMGLDLFRNSNAARKHTAGKSVTIAVLDTGADMDTTVLKERGISARSYDFVNSTRKITDVTRGGSAGHGTRVATLLDDLLPENVDIMVLRVFDETGATQTTVRLALQYALENGADVINMSMGWDNGENYTFLDDVLLKAYSTGVPVICAAGNSSASAAGEYPANSKTTIAVSAVNRSLNYDLRSNYGDEIDFTAPGAELKLIAPGNETVTGRGTSFAAPHIAAAAADVLLCEPSISVPQLYSALRTSATDLGDEGKDWLYGWGLPQMASYISTAIAHLWDDGITTDLATRTSDGLRVYSCPVCGEIRPETIPATKGSTKNDFYDVSADSYYAESVTWAVANVITTGVSTYEFQPGGSCTRAQMVTFLWRASGCPQPKGVGSVFADVLDPNLYYYKAVLWAVEKGITTGTSDTTFSPNDTVTRAQTVTFLWRLAGKPSSAAANPFIDVAADAYFYSPVLWAVQNGITTGMSETTFEPYTPCTRGQIVTFLYRYLGNM